MHFQQEIGDRAAKEDVRLVCDHTKCSKTFKRRGDLVRHQKLHAGLRGFPCTAQECGFSFTRNDKLHDHIRAGHDCESLFACPRRNCSALLTRDVLPMHGGRYLLLRWFRQCPLPRCGFRVRTSDLDNLQQHLLDSHDAKGRGRFASLLLDRGYDHASAGIVCPVCFDPKLITTHKDFEEHLVDNHCGTFRQYEQRDYWLTTMWYYVHLGKRERRVYEGIPQGLRDHRRTILSLMPSFDSHPVWNDIKKCPQ